MLEPEKFKMEEQQAASALSTILSKAYEADAGSASPLETGAPDRHAAAAEAFLAERKAKRRRLVLTASVIICLLLAIAGCSFFLIYNMGTPAPLSIAADTLEADVLTLTLSGSRINYKDSYMVTTDGTISSPLSYNIYKKTISFAYTETMEMNIYILQKGGTTLHLLVTPEEDASAASSTPAVKGERDNTSVCLTPTADGIATFSNDVVIIDYSNAAQGYVCASYFGDCEKVKLRITGADGIVYTYDLSGDGYETFPLTAGSGTYTFGVYENITLNAYSTCLYDTVEITIENELGPFLYPNQYVNFTAESLAVAKAAELAYSADDELEVLSNIYNYIIETISYNYDMAADPPTSYTTDIDEVFTSQTGICLDYAALMAAMLRSQRIPTRLEIGYAGDAYHAWISIYIDGMGWLNGIIEIEGSVWTLVDPTFGANTDADELKAFIGDGSNYTTMKIY